MSDIFSYTDPNGEQVSVSEQAEGLLHIYLPMSPWVDLAPKSVARLRDALTAWLGDGTPEPAALSEERVREIVRDELRSVPAPGVVALGTDPSPHDVGHAEDIWSPPCNGCTHSTGVHVSSGCTDPGCGCTRMPGECAQPGAPAPDALCECGHLERVHSGRDAHCIEWISNALVCSCASYVRLVP